jgi:hypothetical protein
MAVTISYPTSGASVPGNGGLFAWGTVTADDGINQVYVQWQPPGAAVSTVAGVAVNPPPAPCNFAYAFGGVAVGSDITLYVVADSGTVTVTFRCICFSK